MAQVRHAVRHVATEWAFASGQDYADPFNEVDLDVVFTRGRRQWRVPAFWAGGQEWRVRFAAPEPGTYAWRTACTDAGNGDLHGVEGRLEAKPYAGDNPLIARGPLRVAKDRRHLEHADGTPFFWLADTWWMGLTRRFRWPDDFQRLAADRAEKGFTVIQIVAGLYPDMPAFDPRGASEAGFPWETDYARINPAYFDAADLRIQWLVRCGLAPCVVGCWAYFLPWMGVERMKRHWRYLVARWGAYPAVWCLAGEAAMVYYRLFLGPEADKKRAAAARAAQTAGWAEVGRYVRHIDAHRRLITLHPGPTCKGRDEVDDDRIMDFQMLQTGHGGRDSIPNTARCVIEEVRRRPAMPVIDAEVNYEGILHGTDAEMQRLAFWICILSGAAGHTYGANGIWQMNTPEEPFGPGPHGATWGNMPWQQAYRLPGAGQLALAKRLLERYAWWCFRPHPEWVAPAAGPDDYFQAYAAGIPRQVRLIYLWHPVVPWAKPPVVKRIEKGVRYRAFFWDPRSGAEHALGVVRPDARGRWRVPFQPEMTDWLCVFDNPHRPRA